MAKKLLASAVAVLWIFSICEVPRLVMSEEQICSDDVYPQEESPDPTPGKLVCPALPPDAVGVCAELCPAKGCPKGYLCCSNGCGHVCKKGVLSKPYPADEDDGGDEPGNNNKYQDCSSSPCPYDKMCVTYDKACGTTGGKLGKRTCGTGRACVPKNSGCTVMRCGFGARCGWKEVYCKKAPCLPVASCLPPSPPPRYEQVDEGVQSADDESVIEEEDPAADEDYVPVATKPPQPQYSYRECSSSRPCPSGRRCATYEKSCILGKNGKITCTTGKACVPNDYSGCAAVTCAARSRCALREALCTQKLCYPKAICIPIDGKPNGNYQQTPTSTTAAPIVPKPSPVSIDGGFGQQPCKRACARGEKCVNVEQQCKRPPADEYDPKNTCRFKQECVLLNFQGCAAAEARCRKKGQRCRLRAVQCITAPCNPVPICE